MRYLHTQQHRRLIAFSIVLAVLLWLLVSDQKAAENIIDIERFGAEPRKRTA